MRYVPRSVRKVTKSVTRMPVPGIVGPRGCLHRVGSRARQVRGAAAALFPVAGLPPGRCVGLEGGGKVPMLSGIRVLVVDDSSVFREILATETWDRSDFAMTVEELEIEEARTAIKRLLDRRELSGDMRKTLRDALSVLLQA